MEENKDKEYNILYKYYEDNCYNKCALENNYIWASTPENFNDPYDCALDLILNNENLETEIKKYIQNKAIICFSEVYDSILMWSHYANHHKGFCIGYKDTLFKEFESEKRIFLNPISYVHSIDLDTSLDEDNIWCQINKILTTKYIDWSYEKEWRFILEYDENTDKTSNGRKFIIKDFESHIEEIILGVKCPDKTEQWLKKIFPKTSIKKLKMLPNKFQLIKEK
jgi:hypothetical protein